MELIADVPYALAAPGADAVTLDGWVAGSFADQRSRVREVTCRDAMIRP